ncbi:MAG: hypothetical protein ABIQ16_00535 [Polyangiaceae bacterium]
MSIQLEPSAQRSIKAPVSAFADVALALSESLRLPTNSFTRPELDLDVVIGDVSICAKPGPEPVA